MKKINKFINNQINKREPTFLPCNRWLNCVGTTRDVRSTSAYKGALCSHFVGAHVSHPFDKGFKSQLAGFYHLVFFLKTLIGGLAIGVCSADSTLPTELTGSRKLFDLIIY